MNAVIAVRQSTFLADALAYYDAVMAQAIAHHTSDELLSDAYRCLENALRSLRTEGTHLDLIATTEATAHALAPAYERHRALTRNLDERARLSRDALGFDRHLARELNELADSIGDGTPEAEAMQRKVLEVSEMIDGEKV